MSVDEMFVDELSWKYDRISGTPHWTQWTGTTQMQSLSQSTGSETIPYSLPDFPVTTVSPPTSRTMSIGFQSLLELNIKFCLLFVRPKWGWHLNISVTPSDLRSLSHPFVLYAPWTGGSSLSLGLGQPWPCLDPFPLLALHFGIAFHLQFVLLSYYPIFLCPYHFLKLVSFLGANRTKSASVCPWLLRGSI